MTDDNELTPPAPGEEIRTIAIEEEMQRSYLDYAMSVIVSRALPDVRDGLKPVHRRILYAMREGGYDWSKPFRKSARIVGDVMGKYHPHGDSAIYDAMVRMAQPFSMRLPLVSGQGNFGSMDGDPPAAMRYTEARLANSAEALLADIDKDTVDFQANYDESEQEPTVLPAQFPNLLVNGAGGIAVGMATNIPTHNLTEVLQACKLVLDNPDTTLDELLEVIPGPDFPTGGSIIGRGGIRQAYATGRGSILMRGKTSVEKVGRDREAIIISEVPFQVNKARMVERIAEVVQLKLIEGISDLRDESDRHGVRVVVELKRDAESAVVLNQLFRYTPLQTTFGVNMLAIDGGRPVMMTLKEVLDAFLKFREQVVTRRTIYELRRARDRAHVLVGLALAVANLDEIIRTIRKAPDPAAAREGIMARDWPTHDIGPLIRLVEDDETTPLRETYRLTEVQARAILDLRLHRLTGLEREKISEELNETVGRIREYLEILGSRERLIQVIREELDHLRQRFGDERRTEIEESEFDQADEDLIQRDDMVVTVTRNGSIKRVPLSTYRAQRRGGKGRSGMSMRDEDLIQTVFVANTHTPLLFFSSAGLVYKLKVWRLPAGTPQARGRSIRNLLPVGEEERITAILPLPEDEESWAELEIVFATASGNVRRNLLSDFTDVRANGKIAMKLSGDDSLVGVAICRPDDHMLLATWAGKCIRFPVDEIRVFRGRNSTGNRGIDLGAEDRVISLSILKAADFSAEERDAYLRWAAAQRRLEANGEGPAEGDEEQPAEDLPVLSMERIEGLQENEEFVLTVASDGYGKRTSAYDYRVTRRGGKGIDLMSLTGPDSRVAAAFPTNASDELVMVTTAGVLIRLPVEGIRIARRNTRGVRLVNTAEADAVASVTRLVDDPITEED